VRDALEPDVRSGGPGFLCPYTGEMPMPEGKHDWIEVTPDPLPVEAATRWAFTPRAGAVVTFQGIVRDHSDGRNGVTALTYEAFEDEARRILAEVAASARSSWPSVEKLALLHRVGELEVSECSVVVVASSPHRTEAFEAARYCIDTLKETAPIWKREHWDGGVDWSTCDHELRPVHAGNPPEENRGG